MESEKIIQHFLVLKLLLSLLLIGGSNTSEMIQLHNKSHIMCIINDQNSPIYLNPPLNLNDVRPWSLNLHDWKSTKFVDTFHKAIIDKRWEGLATFSGTYLPFDLKKSLALSVYSLETNELEFFIDDDKAYMDHISLDLEKGQWIHYSFIVKNGNVYFYKNDNLEQTLINFFPTRLFAKTKMNAFWKIHNYTWLYSDSISNLPAQLTDPPSREDGCSTFYVSLCSTCVLDISGPNISTYTLRNRDNKATWHTQDVYLGVDQKVVNISKRNVDEKVESYWELDIRPCTSVKDGQAIYEVFMENREDHQCSILNRNEDYKRNKRMTKNTGPLLSKCNPGELGKNCNIRCTHLLGSERKYCESHKICQNDNCACAWGYEEPDCIKQCDDGKWGLSCRNNCSENCRLCDKQTGECSEMLSVAVFVRNNHTGTIPTSLIEKNGVIATASATSFYKTRSFIITVSSFTVLLLLLLVFIVQRIKRYRGATTRSEEETLYSDDATQI